MGLKRLLVFRPTVTFRGPVDGAAAALATRCEVPMRSIHHCVPGSVISVAASTRIVVHAHPFCFLRMPCACMRASPAPSKSKPRHAQDNAAPHGRNPAQPPVVSSVRQELSCQVTRSMDKPMRACTGSV